MQLRQEASAVHLSRRAFLAGAGGVAAGVATPTAAAPVRTAGEADLVVEELVDGVVVRFRNERCLRPAVFKIPRLYWADETRDGQADVRLKVTDRSVPIWADGELRRTVTIGFSRARFSGTSKFAATFEICLRGSECSIGLNTVGWPRSGITRFVPQDFISFTDDRPLTVDLSKAEATTLVGGLFGPRLRFSGKASLTFDHGLSWTLAGTAPRGFSTDVGLAGLAPAVATFSTLSFAPSSPGDGPFDADVVARAFPREAPPIQGRDRPMKRMAMSGVSKGDVDIGASVALGIQDRNRIEALAIRATSVAFQHFGRPRDMLSGVSGDFLVEVVSEGRRDGPFMTRDGRIMRFAQNGSQGVARLPVSTKASQVETGHGRFIVESADLLVEAPEEGVLRPGVALSTEAGTLKSFSVSALIRQAFVPFPVSGDEKDRPFFHRMDFAGEACSFALPGLGSREIPWSAGSRIWVGAPPEKTENHAPIQLRLDQAKLRIVRPDDLLSLAFTFSGLALVAGGNGARIAPLTAGLCGVHLVEPVNSVARNEKSHPESFRTGAAIDDRPLMVVEFPPQHVAEKAYWRQIDDGEDPPDVALPKADLDRLSAQFAVLEKYRRTHVQPDPALYDALIAARKAVQDAKVARVGTVAGDAVRTARNVKNAAEKQPLIAPSEPERQEEKSAREIATAAFQRYCDAFAAGFPNAAHADPWPQDQRIYIGSEWLDPDVRRFARQLAREVRASPGRKPSKALGRFPAVDRDSADYRLWERSYDEWGERLFGGLPRYCGPETIQDLLDSRQLSDAGLAALLCRLTGPEDFERDAPTPARLSGATRLAFRVNCDDDDGGAFPFTLERLTDWSRFDLAVVRRAEKVLDFDRSGRLPPHWGRREILDSTSILRHQNIDPALGFEAVMAGNGGTIAARMAQVVAAARVKPQAYETAIELPFRLTLSPAQDARWRTPVLRPRSCLPTPLWTAALQEDSPRSSLRAVWSQDFRPEVFGGGANAPAHGPWAPWEDARPNDDGEVAHPPTRFRATMDAGDRHELVGLSSVYGLPVNGRRDPKTSDLVAEGDQIEPPEGYRLRGLAPGDAIYMPRTLSIGELALSALGGSLDLDANFEPPSGALALDGTAVFEAFDVERWRHLAVLGRDVSVQVVYKGFLFPLGHRVSYVKTTERRFMVHPRGGPVAYLVQRHYLQVGHPEKTYPGLGQADGGRCFPPRVVNILTRRSPDILDPYDRPAVDLQAMPPVPGSADVFAVTRPNGTVSLSIGKKTVLPGVVFWPRTAATDDGTVRFEVQIDEAGGSVTMPMLFVDNKAAHDRDAMRAVTAYWNGLPEAVRTLEHHGIPRRYADETRAGEATFETLSWVLGSEGGPAKAVVDVAAGNADFIFSPPLEGADQPPFYPRLDSCVIRINQVGKLTGHAPPEATARYYPDYVENGFTPKNAAEVFLLVRPVAGQQIPMMQFGASGDRAAGVGRPEQRIVALSRRNGPIGGAALAGDSVFSPPTAGRSVAAADPEPLDFSSFKPKDFFGSFGKLLGIIDLGDVIRVAAGLSGMPELSETIDYVSDQAWNIVRETVLGPLDDALSALDRSLQRIVAGGGGDAAAQFATLFADLDKSKTALRKAVHDALDAEQPSLEVQAKLIGDVYGKARALIAALRKLASDPIGQIEVALRARFDGLIERLLPFKQLNLADLPGELGKAVVGIVFDAGMKDALFDFDAVVLCLSALSDEAGDAKRLRSRATAYFNADVDLARLKAYFEKTHSIETALNDLGREKVLALGSLARDAKTDLDRGILKTAQQELLALVRGPLFVWLSSTIDPLLKASDDLRSAVRGLSGPQPLKSVPGVLEAVAKAFLAADGLVTLLPAFAADRCGAVVDLVVAARKALTTTTDPVADAEMDLGLLEKCLADADACPSTSSDPRTVGQALCDGLSNLPRDDGSWADDLRAVLAPALDQIAKLLESLYADDGPSAARVEAAKDGCSAGDFQALRQLADPFLKIVDVRLAVARSVGECLDAIVKAVASRTFKERDRAALSGALLIYRTLLSLLLNPSDAEVAAVIDAINVLVPGSVAVPPGIPTSAQLAGRIDAFLLAVDKAPGDAGLNDALTGFATAVEREALDAVGDALLRKAALLLVSVSGQARTLVLQLSPFLILGLTELSTLLAALESGRATVGGVLDDVEATPGLGILVSPLAAKLSKALQIDFKPEIANVGAAKDALAALGTSPGAADLKTAKDKLAVAVQGLDATLGQVGVAAKALSEIVSAIAKGDIAKLLDVDAARRQIEDLIRDLVPHKATMAYRLDTELGPLFDIFIPDPERGARRLTIDTTAVVDLTAKRLVPETTVTGTLDPFNIHLFGSAFDVVLLKFKQAKFGSVPGGAFQFHVDLETVVLGEMVEFLEALQSYLSPADGNGFYLRAASGSPGIEVGYGLNLGTISLGPVSFINVGLNAGCRLPFDDKHAQFTIGLSRPEAPFLISAGIYGGGGYLGLIAEGQKIVGFEASFEFGGVAAFSFGPLTGIGRLTTGIFVRKLGDGTTIDGFFFCGGSARIACFGISASLSVTIGMQPGGAMTGQAVFTFSFSIGFAHIDFHITVFKTQSKLGSASLERPASRTRLATLDGDVLALAPKSTASTGRSVPRVFAATMSPNRDWRRYEQYFDHDLRPEEAL